MKYPAAELRGIVIFKYSNKGKILWTRASASEYKLSIF